MARGFIHVKSTVVTAHSRTGDSAAVPIVMVQTIFRLPEEFLMKRLTTLMMLTLFCAGLLSGCNTVAGAGKDMQKAGEKVEDKAQDCSAGKC